MFKILNCVVGLLSPPMRRACRWCLTCQESSQRVSFPSWPRHSLQQRPITQCPGYNAELFHIYSLKHIGLFELVNWWRFMKSDIVINADDVNDIPAQKNTLPFHRKLVVLTSKTHTNKILRGLENILIPLSRRGNPIPSTCLPCVNHPAGSSAPSPYYSGDIYHGRSDIRSN